MKQQRQLLAQADHHRGELWSRVSEHVAAMMTAGHRPHEIAKTLAPIMEPLRKLTMSSGRDETLISPQLAMLFAKPAPPPVSQDWSVAPEPDPDVERFTRAMAIAPDGELKEAFADRLRSALQNKG